jgi:2-octaprenyl-6-methoxyphenol hydroxylase
MTAHEHHVPALGYVASYAAVSFALQTRLQALAAQHPNLHIIRPATVQTLDQNNRVSYQIGTTITDCQATHIVHAEGGLFAAGTSAHTNDTKVVEHDSQQTALLTTVRASRALPQHAFERFCDAGPLALLPIGASTLSNAQQDQYALVWCGEASAMRRLAEADDATFNQHLNQQFGERLGQLTRQSPCHCFTLGLRAQTQLVQTQSASAHQIWLGNAAQTLHPVAGQGLNLGLRDVQNLVHAWQQHGLATPADQAAALTQFKQSRTLDRWGTIGLTQIFSQVFTWPAVSHAAANTLGILDTLPNLRRSLARRMMFGHR